ncbi:MAG: hypothetical protein GF370_02820 [Candidatus Nealsonbacteria bacterium]|nr:hypothetical protein [Candidatus Nealsonbacteria bacterium]
MMVKVKENNQRVIYEKVQIIFGIIFALVFFFAYGTGILEPPQNLLARIIIYSSVPLIIFSLFLTSIRKILPQRIGDSLHALLVIFILSVFANLYDGKVGGFFIFLFFLLIILYTLLLDSFLPIFIGTGVSIVLIIEYFYVEGFSRFIFIDFIKISLQVLSLLTIGIAGSSLVRKTVSEKKKTEELEAAYENIKSLSQMKTEFLKVVNHQLRTPVSIVKGMLSMLEEGSVQGEKKQEFIEKSYLASERLTTILDDILTAQRLTGGPPDISLSPCKVEELIRDIIKHFQPFTKRKNLELKFKEPEEPVPLVFLDKEIVKRTISRLIDNAILYTNEGKVTVSLSATKKGGKDFLEIKVKDSGIGVTEEEKKDLFRLFYRGDKATSTHPNGSGLGLFIVKILIEAHQGEIEVESEGRGKGTTFSVKLPLITEV